MNNRISEALQRELEERRLRHSQQVPSHVNPIWIGVDYASGSDSSCSHDSGSSAADTGSCSSD